MPALKKPASVCAVIGTVLIVPGILTRRKEKRTCGSIDINFIKLRNSSEIPTSFGFYRTNIEEQAVLPNRPCS